jgi:hypothetical protein
MGSANTTAQKVLTHEFRQHLMAEVAVPEQRCGGFLHYRFGCQWNRRQWWRGTLMRHFLLSGPVSTLAFGMGATATMRVLIALAGRPY